jgi:hypothetical protein
VRVYDPRLTDQCREERAEEVRDKEHANFCDWFKPRPNAHRRPVKEKRRPPDQLDNLFGGAQASDGKADAARDKLSDLFSPDEKSENNFHPVLYKIGECQDCDALNATLRARIELLPQSDVVRRHHYLGGRYENLYVAFESIPEIRVILDLATAQAAHILNRPKKNLRVGWWLNIMRPGDITFAHTR